jgi:cell division protein ZapA (FtsZ GTPase activity inhibitor)
MSVQITIRNRQYTLRSDEPEEDLEAVARYVDGRMESMSKGSLDEYTVALLTALNIASEYHRFRQQVIERIGGLDKDVAAVSAILEAALPERNSGGSQDALDEAL